MLSDPDAAALYDLLNPWDGTRYLPPNAAEVVDAAGLTIEAQYGDWNRGPVTDASREIITIARRA